MWKYPKRLSVHVVVSALYSSDSQEGIKP